MRYFICFLFLIIFSFLTCFVGATNLYTWSAGGDPYDSRETSDQTDMGKVTKNVVKSDGSISRLKNAFLIQDDSATAYISTVINYFLGILSFIALLVLIYGFYLMFVSNNQEEAFTKAKKYVGIAVLSIFIIGLSWYITSWLFYIVS